MYIIVNQKCEPQNTFVTQIVYTFGNNCFEKQNKYFIYIIYSTDIKVDIIAIS
jgi:hypothetical protein